MTEEEFNTFCNKFRLLSASKYTPPTTKAYFGLYIPYQIQYMFSDYDYLEIASVQVEISNNKITDVILKFKTRELNTSTFNEACSIFEFDFLPKIKMFKLNKKIECIEQDFE